MDWIARAVSLGAGEVLVTAVDQEGTRKGLDIELMRAVNARVNVPVIASGGFGDPADLKRASDVGTSAIAIADALHWKRTTVGRSQAAGKAIRPGGQAVSAASGKPVTVIDYGIGNLLNVVRALRHCGAEVTVVDHATQVKALPDRLVLPGVGAFADGMMELKTRGFDDLVKSYAQTERPFFGICVGAQMLFDVR